MPHTVCKVVTEHGVGMGPDAVVGCLGLAMGMEGSGGVLSWEGRFCIWETQARPAMSGQGCPALLRSKAGSTSRCTEGPEP